VIFDDGKTLRKHKRCAAVWRQKRKKYTDRLWFFYQSYQNKKSTTYFVF